jgi:hypothetical protein
MLALAGIAAIFCRCRDDPAVASNTIAHFALDFPGTDSKPAGLLFSPASAKRRHHCNDHLIRSCAVAMTPTSACSAHKRRPWRLWAPGSLGRMG